MITVHSLDTRTPSDPIRRRIVDVAMELARSRGDYRQFTIRELARRVSMSPGALYQLFPAKSEIERAVRARVFADLRNELAGPNVDEDPASALVAWLRRFARHGGGDPVRRSCLIDTVSPTSTPDPQVMVGAAELLSVLEGARELGRLRDGLTPHMALRLVWIFANGLLGLRPARDDGTSASELMGTAIPAFVGGIIVRGVERLSTKGRPEPASATI